MDTRVSVGGDADVNNLSTRLLLLADCEQDSGRGPERTVVRTLGGRSTAKGRRVTLDKFRDGEERLRMVAKSPRLRHCSRFR